MVDERIRVGDAVALKSGGPVMKVQALSMSLAYCAWAAGERRHQGTFEVDSLELVDRASRKADDRASDSGPGDNAAWKG